MTDPWTGTIALAQPPTPTAPRPGEEGGQGEDFGKSSPVGFVVLLLFFVAVIFLVRSMNKHLRRVPDTFEGTQAEPPGAEPTGADPTGSGPSGSGPTGAGPTGADREARDGTPSEQRRPDTR